MILLTEKCMFVKFLLFIPPKGMRRDNPVWFTVSALPVREGGTKLCKSCVTLYMFVTGTQTRLYVCNYLIELWMT